MKDLKKKISSEDFLLPFVGIVWAVGVLFLWLSGLFAKLIGRLGDLFGLIVIPFEKSILGHNLLSDLLILALILAVIIGSLIIFFWWIILIPIYIFPAKKKG